jgi:hypothetical protein
VPSDPRTRALHLSAAAATPYVDDRVPAWDDHLVRQRTLKETAQTLAVHHKIPRIDRADIVVEYRPPAHRHPMASAMLHDADNLCPTEKPLVDGITQAGVFVRDNSTHVLSVKVRIGPKSERGQVLLHITEVTP